MNSSSNKTLISIKAKIPGKIIKMDFNQGIEALNMTKKMKEEAEGEGEEEEEEEEVMMGMEEEEMTMEEEGEEVEILRTIENHGMTTKTMKDFLKSREQNCFLMTTQIMPLMIIDLYLINDQSNLQIFLLIDGIFLYR